MSGPTGVLVLEDGLHFYGKILLETAYACGEVCFNTAMSGYQEVVSDPSYDGQIVVFSFPHIGNVGTNLQDEESGRIRLKAVVLGDAPTQPSNFRSTASFFDYLKKNEIPALFGVDTRALIKRIVASQDPIKAIVSSVRQPLQKDEIVTLANKAADSQSLSGNDLSRVAGGIFSFTSVENEWSKEAIARSKPKVAILDFGVKANILRCLSQRGITPKLYPQGTTVEQLLEDNIDGIVLSNGPGDPRAIDPAVLTNIRRFLSARIPLLGICLGFQLIALSFEAKVKQLKSGHHGINHPVKNLLTEQISITSQNHEFYVEEMTLPDHILITHKSLFDGTLEGFKSPDGRIVAVQFHPEAAPGPNDTKIIFDQFIDRVEAYAKKK